MKLGQDEDIIELKCQGFSLCTEYLDLQAEVKGKCTSDQVHRIASFLDSSSLCSGFVMANKDEAKHLPDRLIVSVSNLTDPNKEEEKRIYSTRCKGIAPPGQCCESCSSLKRNETKRKIRRESNGGDTFSRCNNRYLSQEGLSKKSAKQKRAIKNGKARESAWRQKFQDQLIQVEEQDHMDLMSMFNKEDTEDLPPDMAILWNQQKQILQTHSNKGYRWHPK